MAAPGFASVPLFGPEQPSAPRRPGSPAILRGGAALGGAVSLHLLLLLVTLRVPAQAPVVSLSASAVQEISVSLSGSSVATLSASPMSAVSTSAASTSAPSSRATSLNPGPSMPAARKTDFPEATGALGAVDQGVRLDGGTTGALAGGLGNGEGRGASSGDSDGDNAQKAAQQAAQKAKLVRSRTCDDLFPWDATGERETVTVQLLVPASGVPKVHRVLSASSDERGFVKAAEACSRRLRFEPARDEKGRTVATKATVRLRFERGAS